LGAVTRVYPRLDRLSFSFGVAMAEGFHLFPFRTEKLSPPAPMVLPGKPGGRVGRRPINVGTPAPHGAGVSCFESERPVRTRPSPALGPYPWVHPAPGRPSGGHPPP